MAVTGMRGVSWAGLLSGPAAWGLSTQGNYALAMPQCLSGVHPTPWVALLLALIALAGGALSFLTYRRTAAHPEQGDRKPRTETFYAVLSMGVAVLFALVILLQGFAGMVFTGCER
jgi:hypothetical protein